MAIPSSLSTLPFVYVVNLFFHLFWEDILELSLLFLFLSPSPGDHPNPEIKPGSPAQKTDSLPSEPPGKPKVKNVYHALNVFGKGKKSYRTTDRKHRF